MRKKDKNSADGRTAEVAHHTQGGGAGDRRDEDLGAVERAEEEMAAEAGTEGGADVRDIDKDEEKARSETSASSSGEDEVKHVKK
jgi:hypothetical protein